MGLDWSACAYFSTNGAVGLSGNNFAVFRLLAEVGSFGAIDKDECLINAIFSVLLPYLIFSAVATSLHNSVVKRFLLRAFDAC